MARQRAVDPGQGYTEADLIKFGYEKHTNTLGVIYYVNPTDADFDWIENPDKKGTWKQVPWHLIENPYVNKVDPEPTRETQTGQQGREVTSSALGQRIAAIYGEVRVGGDVFMQKVAGNYYRVGYGLGHGEMDSVQKMYMNYQGAPLYEMPASTAYWAWEFKNGATNQTASQTIADAFGITLANAPIFPGLAYVATRWVFDSQYMSSPPDPKFLVRGRKCYDPRLDAGYATVQTRNATTVVWTQNDALILADYMSNNWFGLGLGDGGLDWQSVYDAANYCDTVVGAGSVTDTAITAPGLWIGGGGPLAGTLTFSAAPAGGRTATGTITLVQQGNSSSYYLGAITITDPGAGYTAPPTLTFGGTGFVSAPTVTLSVGEPRHQMNIAIRRETTHKANIDTLRQHFRCSFTERKGKIAFVIDQAKAATYTVNANNARPHSGSRKGTSRVPTAGILTWVNPKKDWQNDQNYVYTANCQNGIEEYRPLEMSLEGVTRVNEATRNNAYNLGKARANLNTVFELISTDGHTFERGDRVTVVSDLLGIPGGVDFILDNVKDNGNGRFLCDVSLYNSALYVDSVGAVESHVPTGTPDPYSDLAAPSTLTLTEQVDQFAPGQFIPKIIVNFTPVSSPFYGGTLITYQVNGGTVLTWGTFNAGPVVIPISEGINATVVVKAYTVNLLSQKPGTASASATLVTYQPATTPDVTGASGAFTTSGGVFATGNVWWTAPSYSYIREYRVYDKRSGTRVLFQRLVGALAPTSTNPLDVSAITTHRENGYDATGNPVGKNYNLNVDVTVVNTAGVESAGVNIVQATVAAFSSTGVATAVNSVFGRVGAVVAVTGDYAVAQIMGAAPLASPTFTGGATITGAQNLTFAGMPIVETVTSTDTAALGAGGGIGFNGSYTGTTPTTFAVISGVKEDGVAGNYGGALLFGTRLNGGTLAEKMRLSSTGNLSVLSGYVYSNNFYINGAGVVGNAAGGSPLLQFNPTSITSAGTGNFVYTSGNVGIGGTPTARFHVFDAADTWLLGQYTAARTAGNGVRFRAYDGSSQFMGELNFRSLNGTNNASSATVSVGNGAGGGNDPVYILGGGSGQLWTGAWQSSLGYGFISLNGRADTGSNFYSSPGDLNLYINRPSGYSIFFREQNGASQVSIAPGGYVGINVAPATGKALYVNGFYGDYAAWIANTYAAGFSFGLLLDAGRGATDYNLRCRSAANAELFNVRGDSAIGINAVSDGVSQVLVNSAFGSVNNAALKIWYSGAATVLGEVAFLAHRNSAWSTIYANCIGSASAYGLFIDGTLSHYIKGPTSIRGLLDPFDHFTYDFGKDAVRWRSIYAAELRVQTLIAQKTIATIGGRILVGPTCKLTSDFGAAATTLSFDNNQMVNGDVVYMESAPGGVQQIEFMQIISAPAANGAYWIYNVTRNLDGTGADNWKAGDAVFNTGQAGNGFIDLYSVRGTKASTELGPTIVGNVRNSATFNDWSPRWAIGNLNGLYGYAANIYGVALGVPTGAWIKIDPTNGVRIGFNATTNIQLDASGNASFSGSVTATSGVIGGLNIGSSKIYVGAGLFGGSTTQFYTDSGGQFSLKDKFLWDGTTLTILAGNVSINAGGGTTGVVIPDSSYSNKAFMMSNGGTVYGGLWGSGGTNVSIGALTGTKITVYNSLNYAICTGAFVADGFIELSGSGATHLDIDSASGVINIGGTQVIKGRQAAVADATNATDVITQLNALLARLRTHGLIS